MGVGSRSVTDVGKGDFVKVNGRVLQIASNSAAGASHTPRHWEIVTTDGRTLSGLDIERYYRAGDRDIPRRC